MANGSDHSRSILRLLIGEGLAAAGLVYARLHPYADPLWNLNFFYNALFFLLAYPILYVYRWTMAEGCLAAVLWPVSFVLSWGLGVSCYLWIAYLLLLGNSPYFYAMKLHYVPLGVLFAFIYFPLIQPILGVGPKYQTLGGLLGLFLYSALGGFFGYETGWFLSRRFPAIQTEHSHWLLLWLGLTFLGTAIGAQVAPKRNS